MHDQPEQARRLAALAALGFERVEGAVELQVEPLDRRVFRVIHSRPGMGTRVTVSVVAGSVDLADSAIGEAFELMDRLIGVLSHYDEGSAATRLNRDGRLPAPPPELLDVVSEARRYHRLTHGGFDVSVAPVLELFRQNPNGKLPDRSDIVEALDMVGAERIDFSRRNISLRRQGMRLTLDGIAKGYIVDAIARVLDRHRIIDYLVEAGGDLRLRGSRGLGEPWRIALRDPSSVDRYLDLIALDGGAVATSGSYEESYDADREHHHIVSAETGASPRLGESVTVVAPTAMAADALATSVFLMCPSDGVRFLDSLPGCEAFIVDRHGGRMATKGWPGNHNA